MVLAIKAALGRDTSALTSNTFHFSSRHRARREARSIQRRERAPKCQIAIPAPDKMKIALLCTFFAAIAIAIATVANTRD